MSERAANNLPPPSPALHPRSLVTFRARTKKKKKKEEEEEDDDRWTLLILYKNLTLRQNSRWGWWGEGGEDGVGGGGGADSASWPSTNNCPVTDSPETVKSVRATAAGTARRPAPRCQCSGTGN